MDPSTKFAAYPLVLTPVFRAESWAGTLLSEFRGGEASGGHIPAGTGSAWLVSDAPTTDTCVSNGPLAGVALGELVRRYPAELVGRRQAEGAPFPICVRILDVGQALNLQVHADEALARELPEWPTNTKFWYCLLGRDDAEIMVGITGKATAMQLTEALDSPGMRKLLQTFPALAGDSYLIPAGRVHGATAGTLIWEIGQRPAPTLCVSGWSRESAAGTAERATALRAVHFEDRQGARICRETGSAVHTRRLPLVHHCPYFMVDEIRLVDHLSDRTDGESFHLFSVVRGCMVVKTDAGNECLRPGSVCVIPASLGGYRCEACDGAAAVLRVRLQRLR